MVRKGIKGAQFTTPYTTAIAFIRGGALFEAVDEDSINDAKILELGERFTPVLDSTRKIGLVAFASGNPKNLITIEGCTNKSQKCTKYSLKPFSDKQNNKLIEGTNNLEQLHRIDREARLMAQKKNKITGRIVHDQD